MGNVLFMRKGETHSEPISFDPVFANNDWTTIIEACQKNKVPETWVVGDSKPMTINNVSYTIDIIGKNHDPYSDGSGTAPITFQMHDCYGTSYKMNSSSTNSVGWADCEMRTTHLPSIMVLMPSEVQAAIMEVDKVTSAGNQSSALKTTADKLFLPSEQEIFGERIQAYSGEGDQYAYYAAGNSTYKGIWWLRSPRRTSSTSFCHVDSTGSASYDNANQAKRIAFAFCF